MKKNIISALFCALAIVGVAACNKPAENFEQKEKTHTVTFMAKAPSADETKTAIMLKMVPDWRNTDVNDVHIFETETASSGNAYFMEASKVEMTTPVDGTWEKAYFYAEFDNATVIVNPPSALTKAGSTFAYTALMATRENDKYLVPAVQYPHVESLIDPKADFLIGTCPNTYSSSRHEQRVFLDFSRPVALSRLAVTNLAGSYVESVKISCVENTRDYNGIITGEVGYADVDFETNTADFQANADSYELTLSYPDGLKRSATTYVYMVTVPGTKSIKSVEVVTDKYIYTKSFTTPASLTFYASEFINIAMDMTVGGNVTRVDREPLEMEYDDAYGQPVTEFEYDVYTNSAADFGSVAPTLYIADIESAGTITYSSSNTDVATVDESGNVTLTGIAGETTITATASGDGHQYMSSSASYKLTVTNSAPEVTYYKASAIDDGYDYMIVSAANALRLSSGSLSEVAVTVDLEAGTASLEPVEGLLWTAAAIDASLADYGTHSFSQGSYNLTRLSDSGSYQLVASSDDLTKHMVWNYDGTNFWNTSIYESTVTDFYAYYNEGWRIASSGYGATALYTSRMPQSISFENATVSYDLYADASAPFTGQTVSGDAKTDVTYSIDNTAVATINPANGAVEVVGKGVAVITATAAASDNWQSAVASYELVVTDTTPTEAVTLYKADEILAGQQYVVVSSGKAMAINGDELAAVDVDDKDGVIEIAEGAVAFWTAAEHIEYYSGTSAAGHYTLQNGDNYLQRLSNESVQVASFGPVPERPKLYVWEYDGTHLYQISSSSNTFYMGYADSEWKFNYQSPYYQASLYSATKPLTKQTIAFDATTVQYDLNGGSGKVAAPAWAEGKEPKTTVTFATESTVVSIDETTGEVTINEAAKNGDEALITATAAQTEEYASATATFKVKVIDSSAPVVEATYTLVTSSSLSAGTYLIISDDSNSAYNNRYTVALFPTIVTASWGSVENGQKLEEKDVTLNGNSITTDDAEVLAAEVELVASGSGWKLKIKQTGEYFAAPTDSYKIPVTLDANEAAVFTASTSSNRSFTTGNYYFFHSGSATGFTIRNTSVSSTVSNIRFYKKVLRSQELSFSGESAVYDIYVPEWTTAVPTLDASGAFTKVTYASSNTAVAVVDPETGAVTIAGTAASGDTAVITATAESDEEYDAVSASYTITITSSDPSVPKYVKAEEIENGQKYLVVSNGYLLQNKGSSTAAAVDVSTNFDGDVLKYSPATSELWTATSSSGKFTFKNDTRSLYRSSSSFSLSSSSSVAWSLTEDMLLTTSGTSSTYYLYYSTGNSAWSVNTNASNTHTAYLYVLDDGQPKKRNLAFSASAVSVNIYGKTLPYAFAGAPTLSGKTDGVTYSVTCSDASVAASAYPTVSAAGAVAINGTGVFTVKASAPATAELQAGEASYTLTVTNTAPPTYTKVSEITSGATYLIVSTDYEDYNGLGQKRAFAGTTSGSMVEVDGTSGTITGDFEACEFVITAEGDATYSLKGPNGYVTGNSATDPYIQVSESKVTVTLTDAATLKAATSTDGLVSDAFYFYYIKSSSKEVLYLAKDKTDSTKKYFKMGGSGRKYGVYLYKKN